MTKLLSATALVALLATGFAGAAHAQATAPADIPGHPRINEVDQRLENQQERIDNGVKDGQINAKQEMHDENRDEHVSQELSKDEAEHNGHITKAEQRRMNHQLNRESHKIHHQRVKGAAENAPVAQ